MPKLPGPHTSLKYLKLIFLWDPYMDNDVHYDSGQDPNLVSQKGISFIFSSFRKKVKNHRKLLTSDWMFLVTVIQVVSEVMLNYCIVLAIATYTIESYLHIFLTRMLYMEYYLEFIEKVFIFRQVVFIILV